MLKEFWNEDTILASLILEKNKENSIPFCIVSWYIEEVFLDFYF